jgi:hypothetical protein
MDVGKQVSISHATIVCQGRFLLKYVRSLIVTCHQEWTTRAIWISSLFAAFITLYCTFDWLYNTYKVKLVGALFSARPREPRTQSSRQTKHMNEKRKAECKDITA